LRRKLRRRKRERHIANCAATTEVRYKFDIKNKKNHQFSRSPVLFTSKGALNQVSRWDFQYYPYFSWSSRPIYLQGCVDYISRVPYLVPVYSRYTGLASTVAY
jgi:hypothetical protein